MNEQTNQYINSFIHQVKINPRKEKGKNQATVYYSNFSKVAAPELV